MAGGFSWPRRSDGFRFAAKQEGRNSLSKGVTVHVWAKGTRHLAVPPLQGFDAGWDATQGSLPSGEGIPNIEHRTPNVEGKRREDSGFGLRCSTFDVRYSIFRQNLSPTPAERLPKGFSPVAAGRRFSSPRGRPRPLWSAAFPMPLSIPAERSNVGHADLPRAPRESRSARDPMRRRNRRTPRRSRFAAKQKARTPAKAASSRRTLRRTADCRTWFRWWCGRLA